MRDHLTCVSALPGRRVLRNNGIPDSEQASYMLFHQALLCSPSLHRPQHRTANIQTRPTNAPPPAGKHTRQATHHYDPTSPPTQPTTHNACTANSYATLDLSDQSSPMEIEHHVFCKAQDGDAVRGALKRSRCKARRKRVCAAGKVDVVEQSTSMCQHSRGLVMLRQPGVGRERMDVVGCGYS